MLVKNGGAFLSGISTFFKKDSVEGTVFTIMSMIKGVKMAEQTLFGRQSRYNSVCIRCYMCSSCC